MGNNHYRRKEEESKRMYITWGKRRKVSNRMCLLGATHNVWCSMASAAVVGAAAVGLVAIGAAEVGAPSGVLYAGCSISVAVVV